MDGASIGQHPLVSRLLKGVFHSRPLLSHYSGTLDVARVLSHLKGHNLEDSNLSPKCLTLQTVMLLALTRPSRLEDLAKLSLKELRNTPEGAVFLPAALAKQCSPGRTIKELYIYRMYPRIPTPKIIYCTKPDVSAASVLVLKSFSSPGLLKILSFALFIPCTFIWRNLET